MVNFSVLGVSCLGSSKTPSHSFRTFSNYAACDPVKLAKFWLIMDWSKTEKFSIFYSPHKGPSTCSIPHASNEGGFGKTKHCCAWFLEERKRR